MKPLVVARKAGCKESVDDDRYKQYLSNNSSVDVSKELKGKLAEVKVKLGLRGLSNSSALLLAAVILILCLVGMYSYSPSFRELVTGRSRGSEAALTKADGNESLSSENPTANSNQASAGGETAHPPEKIMVYVSGAVNTPDVYELQAGARAVDALEAAGGFLDSSAREALNLAVVLEDGMQIHFLTEKEFEEQGGGLAAIISANPSHKGSGVTSSSVGAGMTRDGLVNLNTADSTLLQTLSGIGPVTADKIVQDREKNGPYASLEDLTRVSGIGPKRVEALDGVASVGP